MPRIMDALNIVYYIFNAVTVKLKHIKKVEVHSYLDLYEYLGKLIIDHVISLLRTRAFCDLLKGKQPFDKLTNRLP